MAFEHPVVPAGEFRIHIISHPAGKPSRFKERLVRQLIPVTREGFGKTREPSDQEVTQRTTHPDVSLLLYVEQMVEDGKGKPTTRPVGYFSTKNLLDNTIHLHASVIRKEDQRLAWYPLCKRIAMALGPAQLRLEGGQPAFFTAQSAYPFIHRDLHADGMMPAQFHEDAGLLSEHLSRVADVLRPHNGFDPQTSIRHAAFDFDAHEGKTDEEIRELIANEMKKMKDTKLAQQYTRLLGSMGRQDALMAIRRYKIPEDRNARKDLARMVSEPQVNKKIWAELLAGSHRRDIRNVQVEFGVANPSTGLFTASPVVTIRFKPERWDMTQFTDALAHDPSLRRMKQVRLHSGSAFQYAIQPDAIRAPLDAAGLKFIHLALSNTRTAQIRQRRGRRQ